ncbi:MAG: hypothetical protein PHG04_03510 [Candidatus Nanoarchaeia archaeon]|nr:hypothetical protein [Candidatus Nanoarchaeia archaeon]MDD5054416.1 hypothetical protein [Candidatus Nanoarchaeia archaeon]
MSEQIPIQKVIDMRNQGFSNEKIIESLLAEKFTYQQIRDAVQQAEIKKNISNPGEAEKPSMQNPPIPENQKPGVSSAPLPQRPQPSQQNPSAQRQTGINIDEIQRILEEIISEKWRESEEVIRNMIEWKAVMGTKMKDFETRMSEFNARIDSMNSMLGSKAEEFNQTMTEVDTEIKALDKALNKLIPALSDNISELKDMVKKK